MLKGGRDLRKFYFILPILTICLLSFFPSFQASDHEPVDLEGPKAPLDPTVWIQMEQETYNVTVEPGMFEPFEIKGWVHCEVSPASPPGTRVRVTLTILGDAYFSESYLFIFDRTNEVEEFTLLGQDMQALSVENIYQISLYPEWSIDNPQRNGAGVPAFVNIRPLPYCWLRIQEVEDQQFDVGKWHEIELLIENNGNSDATVNVYVDVPEGFEVSIPNMDFRICEKKVDVFPIRIKQVSGTGKEGSITVRARSSTPGQFNQAQTDVKFQTVGRFSKILSSALVIAFILIGIGTIITAIVMIIRNYRKRGPRTI